MTDPVIARIADQPAAAQEALIDLNNRFGAETSFLDAAQWQSLIDEAFLALSVDTDAALLIAFAHDAAYDNFNFRWFSQRLGNFAYVDRIVVDGNQQGRGLARILYERLFAAAAARGLAHIVCEVNVDPPNPGSDAFHAKMGFLEMGRSRLPHADKVVRYLRRTLT